MTTCISMKHSVNAQTREWHWFLKMAARERAEIVVIPGLARWSHGMVERDGFILKVLIIRVLLENPGTSLKKAFRVCVLSMVACA